MRLSQTPSLNLRYEKGCLIGILFFASKKGIDQTTQHNNPTMPAHHPTDTQTHHPTDTQTHHPFGTQTHHPFGTQTHHPTGTQKHHPSVGRALVARAMHGGIYTRVTHSTMNSARGYCPRNTFNADLPVASLRLAEPYTRAQVPALPILARHIQW